MKVRCERLFPGRIFNARIAEVEGLDLTFSALVVEIDHDGVAVQLQPPGEFEVIEATSEERISLSDGGYEVSYNSLATPIVLADADYDRGCAMLADGNCSEAIVAFTLALTRNPADVQAYYNRGFARAIQLRSMGSMIIVTDTHRNICLESGALELVELAIKDFTQAIAYDPGMLKAFGMRAEMYWTRGQVALARADWDYAARKGDEVAVRLLQERFGETHV